MKMKTRVIIILMLFLIMSSVGCTSRTSENTVNDTDLIIAQEPLINETEISKPELNIMSVTIVQSDVNIKVKNTGDAIAKDVYVGIIGVSDTSYLSWVNPNYDLYIDDLIYMTMLYGNHEIETDCYLSPHLNNSDKVSIYSEIIHKEYIGNINPGEMMVSEFDYAYSHNYNEYIKITWTGDYSIYDVF